MDKSNAMSVHKVRDSQIIQMMMPKQFEKMGLLGEKKHLLLPVVNSSFPIYALMWRYYLSPHTYCVGEYCCG